MSNPIYRILACLLLLSACEDDIAPAQTVVMDECGAAALADLVGQPKSVLEGMRFSQVVRVIGPMTPVTRDYVVTRLNIYHDAEGRITRLDCG